MRCVHALQLTLPLTLSLHTALAACHIPGECGTDMAATGKLCINEAGSVIKQKLADMGNMLAAAAANDVTAAKKVSKLRLLNAKQL